VTVNNQDTPTRPRPVDIESRLDLDLLDNLLKADMAEEEQKRREEEEARIRWGCKSPKNAD